MQSLNNLLFQIWLLYLIFDFCSNKSLKVDNCSIKLNNNEPINCRNGSAIIVSSEKTMHIIFSVSINSSTIIRNITCSLCRHLNYTITRNNGTFINNTTINRIYFVNGNFNIDGYEAERQLPIMIKLMSDGIYNFTLFYLKIVNADPIFKFNQSSIMADNGNIISSVLTFQSQIKLHEPSLNVTIPKSLEIASSILCSSDIRDKNTIFDKNLDLIYMLYFNNTLSYFQCTVHLFVKNISAITSEFLIASIGGVNRTAILTRMEIVPPPVYGMFFYNGDKNIAVGKTFSISVNLKLPDVYGSLDLNLSLIEDSQNSFINRFENALLINESKMSLPDHMTYLNASYVGTSAVITMMINPIISPQIRYHDFNFTLYFETINDTLLLTGRSGNISCSIGKYILFYIPFRFVGPILKPDIVSWKYTEVSESDADVVLITIKVMHTPLSQNDAYEIEATDFLNGLFVEEYPSHFSNIKLLRNGLLQASLHLQLGFLKVGSEYTLKYKAKMLKAYKELYVNSRIETTWKNGQVNSPKFGPSSDLVCLKKEVVYHEDYVYNYGYIFLGIFCGILLGIIIVALIVLCCRKHPSTQYILHRNEVHHTSNEDGRYLSPPPYQDMETKFKKKTIDDINAMSPKQKFLSKFNFGKKKSEKGTVDETLETKSHCRWLTLVIDNKLNEALINIERYHSLDNIWCKLASIPEMVAYKSIHRQLLNFYVKLLDEKNINIVTKNKLTQCVDSLKSSEFKSQLNQMKTVHEKVAYLFRNLMYLSEQFEDICSSQLADVHKNKPIKSKKVGQVTIATENKQKIHEQMQILKNEFSLVIAECLSKFMHDVYINSGVTLKCYLSNVSFCFVMVYLQQFSVWLTSWIKAVVCKEVDILKKKRKITDSCYKEFTSMFSDELDHVVNHINKEKTSICENEEYVMVDKFLKNMTNVVHHYNSTENFDECEQMKDEIVYNILKDHQNMVDSIMNVIKQSLLVFTSRLEAHTVEIYNKRIEIPDLATDDESLSGTPMELYHKETGNHLQDVVKNFHSQLVQQIQIHSDSLEQLTNIIKEKNVDFADFYKDSLIYKRKQTTDIFTNSIILMRVHLLNQWPSTVDECIKDIKENQLYSMQQLYNNFNIPAKVDSIKNLLTKLQTHKESVVQYSLLEKNMKEYYKKLEKCVEFVYKSAQAHVVESHDIKIDSLCKNATAEKVDSTILLFNKVVKEKRLLTQTTELMRKYSSCNDSDDVGVKMNEEFVKKVKKSIAELEKSHHQKNTHIKEDIHHCLQNYIWFLRSLGYKEECEPLFYFLYDHDVISVHINNADDAKNTLNMLLEYGIQHNKENIEFLQQLYSTNKITEEEWNDICNVIASAGSAQQIEKYMASQHREILFSNAVECFVGNKENTERKRPSNKKRPLKKKTASVC